MENKKLPKSKSLNEKALKAEIIERIKERGGLLVVSVKSVGIAYDTFLKWRREDEKFNQDVFDAQAVGNETMLDMSESTLFKAIKDGDIKAVMFHLNNKGGARGYVRRIEATGKEGTPLNLVNLGEIAKEIVRDIKDDK